MKRFLLFLDDIRQPQECVNYMTYRVSNRIIGMYAFDNWVIARNYEDFIATIEERGIPDVVSFDHDLAAIHYSPLTYQESFEYYEKIGYDCAKWLLEYYKVQDKALPEIIIHSANPVGADNIKSVFNDKINLGT